jgi:hypothetical protein
MRTGPDLFTSTLEADFVVDLQRRKIRLWRPAERDVDVSRKYPPLRAVLKLDDVAL